jgi:hypothetical protein
MGFFRSAIGLFRGGARKHRDEGAAEFLKEQAGMATAQPAVADQGMKREEGAAGLLDQQAATVTAQPAVADQGMKREEGAAGLLDQQAATVTAQPAVAGRAVKREARPNPNKPGWGLSIGQEVGKARDDGASRE